METHPILALSVDPLDNSVPRDERKDELCAAAKRFFVLSKLEQYP